MLLRRMIDHVKAQNWTAVALDFVIVVVGVFIGIQVANWNDANAAKARETELLVALREEIETSIKITDQKADAISQVVSAGERSLDFLADGAPCGDDCWPVLVDFFHASQWQPIDVTRTTYDEMRRQGLPRSREVINAMEAYLAQNVVLSITNLPPAYRSRVRQLIPLDVQDYYWKTCFTLDNGAESYVLDCPEGVADDVAARAVANIAADPDMAPLLTEWAGLNTVTPLDLRKQNEAAAAAIAAIDEELERRK
ncbi:MAG: hypothetical protein R3C40_11680 [Parvularculaceae bacterium]